MENASKALMIAATVMLGIFLLTAMIYLFRAGGKVSKAYDDKQINQQLEAHNAKFEFYDTAENTIIDVLSLANLVYSTNEESEYSEGYAVNLEVDCEGVIYSIPSDEKKISDRNMILENGTPVEIYKLLNTPVSNLNGKNSLSVWGGGTASINSGETLSQTRLDANNRTIYKYIFVSESGDDFTYDDITTRVESIKLKLYINPDY